MVVHYIIMSSSYTDGTRIAMDITDKNLLNKNSLLEVIRCIRNYCGQDVPLSTHLIQTESKVWESVVEYDPFFKDVELIGSVGEFVDKIKKSRVLSGLDVANYILSKIKCTHLSLEKLVCFSYADYLCEYSERLFEDKIYAFRHGPVIDSVYDTFKKSGSQYVRPLEFGKDSAVCTSVGELAAKSRILFVQDGAKKIQSIDQTVQKYGRYTAGQMVDITHRNGAPWSHVDSSMAYQVISDDLIKAYHYIENV